MAEKAKVTITLKGKKYHVEVERDPDGGRHYDITDMKGDYLEDDEIEDELIGIVDEMSLKFRKNPGREVTKGYVRERLQDPERFDPESFRTKKISEKTKLVVACPKGKFKRGRCQDGMEAQAKLTKRGNPGITSARAAKLGAAAFREEHNAGAHFESADAALKHANHVLEDAKYKALHSGQRLDFSYGFVDEWKRYHALGKNPGKAGKKGRDNTLLYLGAGLVMAGGIALALMPKAAAKPEDSDSGIQPGPDFPEPGPEPDPYNPGPGYEPEPKPEPQPEPKPQPDPGVDPVIKPEYPNLKIAFSKPGLSALKQGVIQSFQIQLTNQGEQLQVYAIDLVVSSGRAVMDRTRIATGSIGAHSLKVASAEYPTASLVVGAYYDVRVEAWSANSLIATALGTTFQVLGAGAVTMTLVRVGYTAGVVPEVKRAALLQFQPRIMSNVSRSVKVESVMVERLGRPTDERDHGNKYVYSTYPWSEFLSQTVPSWFSDGTHTIIIRATDPLSGELLAESVGTFKVVG